PRDDGDHRHPGHDKEPDRDDQPRHRGRRGVRAKTSRATVGPWSDGERAEDGNADRARDRGDEAAEQQTAEPQLEPRLVGAGLVGARSFAHRSLTVRSLTVRSLTMAFPIAATS